jgi:hypothetical protein
MINVTTEFEYWLLLFLLILTFSLFVYRMILLRKAVGMFHTCEIGVGHWVWLELGQVTACWVGGTIFIWRILGSKKKLKIKRQTKK